MQFSGYTFPLTLLSIDDGTQYFALQLFTLGNIPGYGQDGLFALVIDQAAFHFQGEDTALLAQMLRFIG